MTKLMEWVTVFVVFLSIWLSLITNKIELTFTKHHPKFVLFSPIILALIFGVYTASVVIYRTLTFNDCPEAAKELHKEIEEAKTEIEQLKRSVR